VRTSNAPCSFPSTASPTACATPAKKGILWRDTAWQF